MEGVMMKNKEEYAVAVRKPNNEISIEKSTHKDFSDKVKLFKLPIFRGMLAFVDSMVVGVKVLNYSASFFEEEEEKPKKSKKNNSKISADKKALEDASDFEIEEVSIPHTSKESLKHTDLNKVKADTKKDDKSNALLMALAVLISIVLSVALFMVLPVFLTNLLSSVIESRLIMNLLEGVIRLVIFIGYVIIAARMPEIKRVFMYHGAEHKTINCMENGLELTVQNVKKQSKQHKRCGTSFMLLVILISLVFFMLLPSGSLAWRVLSRVLLVPFIAGVSYEFIRLAGKTDNKIIDILSKPGLLMQGLTTREPDNSMIEVAIEAVGAVFDWRDFLEHSKENKKDKDSNSAKQSSQLKQSSDSKKGKSATQTSAFKKEKSLKQEDVFKKEKPLKQEAVLKKEKTIKQEEVLKNEMPLKQKNISKQDNTLKQEVGQKSNLKQETTLRSDNTLNKSENKKKTASNQENPGNKTNLLKQGNQTNSTAERSRITSVRGKQERDDEEDDEILKALDKFFDDGKQGTSKASGDK